MRARPLLSFVALALLACPSVLAQVSPSEQVQIGPPPVRRAEAPTTTASAEELEKRGDELRAEKDYLDALDYYRVALKKKSNNAVLLNKAGISELLLQRYKEARKDFERSIKADRTYAEAYNNLGVVHYEERKYGKAIKQYEKAIKLRNDAASYYSNLGAAYFATKQFEKANSAYSQALQLDPDIFERVSRAGVSAQLSSPEDRAHFDYVLAKLYAQIGNLDRSLVYLGRALEEGYKAIDDVYKDAEFAELRKDPRFTQLMFARPPAIPQ
ncbi:MAG: tetratricopeptide repeat protein [Acidobacteriia bacterium]|nr:tetratricopeptide repeat protein [Terriglobia bacterium]